MKRNLRSSLQKATFEGNIRAIRQLIKAGTDVDTVISDGMTSLHVATFKGHLAIVQYLVQVGSDVNKADCSGATPLMTACSHRYIKIARFLIQSGANVNAVNKYLESPLMYLCRGLYGVKATNILDRRMRSHGDTFASRDFCGCLHFAKLLVASGADINLVDDDGMSPLVGFITYKHYTVAKFLIRSGADINLVDKRESTALLLACQSQNSLELLQMLISAGADVNYATFRKRITPLMVAVDCNTYDKVKALLHAGALVNATDSEGDTALKYAVIGKNPSIIEILIKAGASVGKELILAVFYGYGESIQSLVSNGALPGTYGEMSGWRGELKYLMSSCFPDFLIDKLLGCLEFLRVTSLTPFMLAVMRSDTAVARYFVRNLFFHPLDILLLQFLQKKRSMLYGIELNSCLSPLISQPWSLFNLSFLCVSFAVGFSPDREERILLTGLPASLHRMLLYRDKAAFLPVKDWANLDIFL